MAHNPFELDLIEVDLESWLAELKGLVDAGAYVPGAIEVCDFPKAGGLVRPGSRMSVADRVVFTAAIGASLDQLDAVTRWSQGVCDFASRLDPSKLDKRNWFRNPFKGWNEFHDRSLQRVDSSACEFVVTADVAGFFENVSIGLLKSDLQRIDCPEDAVALIGGCLNAWTRCPDRGLPQGVFASDLLAKLYLEPVDRRLKAAGFVHMRYTDDFRIFCATEEEAHRALVVLTHLLRERGLSLQSSKTQIRAAEDAREEIDGVKPAIEKVAGGYVDEVIEAGLMAGDVSLPMVAIDDLVGDAETNPVVLRRAFKKFVIDKKRPNKTMLHWLLRRLAGQGDRFAVEECARRLETNPEHTQFVAEYFEALGQPDELHEIVVEALRTETGAIYPYQRYLLLTWMIRNSHALTDSDLTVVRLLATRPESPPYVQAVAYQLLGMFGDHGDLESIEGSFKAATDQMERAQLLCCLSRLEKSRRNALAGRVGNDKEWVGRAVRLVRRRT